MIQLLPFAEEKVISSLEQRINKISSVTDYLRDGKTPEGILQELLEDFNLKINDRINTEFYCNCDKERVERALISIGKKELEDMIKEGKDIEVNCHFCNTHYTFCVKELEELKKHAIS